jgi:hypothetical protein
VTVSLNADTRTFRQRFGDRCFCGENWSSPRKCGSGADYTIRDALELLFADRTKECARCGRQIRHDRTYCHDCSEERTRERNRGDRHAIVELACEWCGSTFEARSDKRGQKYCSLSHGNMARHARAREEAA